MRHGTNISCTIHVVSTTVSTFCKIYIMQPVILRISTHRVTLALVYQCKTIGYLKAGLEVGLESALDGSHVLAGSNPGLTLLAAAGQSQILGHDALIVDNLNASALKLLSKGNDIRSLVELATLDQTAGPGEDGGNGVGGGLAALLVLAVVTGHGTVGSLRLESLASRGDQGRGHQTKGAETLGDNVGLDITVVVYTF